jgi:hypothetical protein
MAWLIYIRRGNEPFHAVCTADTPERATEAADRLRRSGLFAAVVVASEVRRPPTGKRRPRIGYSLHQFRASLSPRRKS